MWVLLILKRIDGRRKRSARTVKHRAFYLCFLSADFHHLWLVILLRSSSLYSPKMIEIERHWRWYIRLDLGVYFLPFARKQLAQTALQLKFLSADFHNLCFVLLFWLLSITILYKNCLSDDIEGYTQLDIYMQRLKTSLLSSY